MPVIRISTVIRAPIDVVFNLSRSIDLHKLSMAGSNEEAVAGKTSGLIGLGETVTWKAKHFGFYHHLTVRISDFDYPRYFQDRMVKGIFNEMVHDHYFEATDEGTLMTDQFLFRSPLGILGEQADKLFLTAYMTRLLKMRNDVLRSIAEGQPEFL